MTDTILRLHSLSLTLTMTVLEKKCSLNSSFITIHNLPLKPERKFIAT